MDPRALYPTCVLKVDLGCCQTCAVRLKKLLSKVHGVYAVHVNAEKGLVKAWGTIDPAILVKKIAERKKKAELFSYEEPVNGQIRGTQRTQTGKDECCGGGGDEKRKGHRRGKDKEEDYFCPDRGSDQGFENYRPRKEYEDFECRDSDHHHYRFHQEEPFMAGNNRSAPVPVIRPRHLNLPPRPNPHYPPPRTRPYRLCYKEVSEMESPNLYGRPLPNYDNESSCSRCPPPTYNGYYATKYVPGGTTNDFTHFFSDENATGCSIL